MITDYDLYHRTLKGRSLLFFPDNYTVIDLETTGLSPRCDDIIELAAIRVRNGKPQETFQKLVKPENGIPGFISLLTRITNEMVADAPPIGDVMGSYLNFIGDDIVVGHNVGFDVNFIFDNAVATVLKIFENDYVDTLRLARRLVEIPRYRLVDLRNYFDVPDNGAHRALNDCYVTQTLFERLRGIYNETNCGCIIRNLPEHKNDRKFHRQIDLKLIKCQIPEDEINKSNPLYGKNVCFTGMLERFRREDAMQLVANLGGKNQNGVTKQTDFLVLGNNDYCRSIKDGKSSKQKKAEKYLLEGTGIAIMPEQTFYEMIEEYED